VINKKYFLSILRWGLRFHGAGHLIEVVSAISEGAYITATIALIFITIEILASFFIPDEHVHFKPFKTEVHADCEAGVENIEKRSKNV
tara:strand:- start:190 stop:453 length:264 start_codon:yes stop_codon:yes gene_type:complete